MQKSISHKVSWGVGAILLVAMLAMGTTYFVSTTALKAVQESHELNQAMLTSTANMEVDTISGGLKVLQYLQTDDAAYRQAYQPHS